MSTSNDAKLQNLLKRIRDLKEIVQASTSEIESLTNDPVPPLGYTPARWQLALQSFSQRLPALRNRNYFSTSPRTPLKFDSQMFCEKSEADLLQFGPEWDLKCAQLELEELLKQ